MAVAVRHHGEPAVLGDEVRVERRGDGGPRRGRGDHRRAQVGHVPDRPHPRHRGLAPPVDLDHLAHQHVPHALLGRGESEQPGHLGAGPGDRRHEQRVERDDGAVGEPHAAQRVVGDLERRHRPGHHLDAAGVQLVGGVALGDEGVVEQEHDVVGQLAHQTDVVHGQRARGQDSHASVPDLPPVAVRAVQHVAPPALAHARDVGQVVDDAGREHHPSGSQLRAVRQPEDEAALVPGRRRHHPAGPHDPAVPLHLGPPDRGQLSGRGALAAQVVVHPVRGRVPRLPRVDHQHPPSGPRQREGRRQPSGATTDDHHVPRLVAHGREVAPETSWLANILATTAKWTTSRRCWTASAPGCGPCARPGTSR